MLRLPIVCLNKTWKACGIMEILGHSLWKPIPSDWSWVKSLISARLVLNITKPFMWHIGNWARRQVNAVKKKKKNYKKKTTQPTSWLFGPTCIMAGLKTDGYTSGAAHVRWSHFISSVLTLRFAACKTAQCAEGQNPISRENSFVYQFS